MLPHYVYNIQVSQLPHSVTIMWYASFFQPALDWCFCLLFCRIGTLENEEEVAGMRMEDSKRSKRPHTFCRNNFQSLGWSPSTPLAPLIRKHLYDDTYNSFCTKNNSQIKKKNMDCMARKTWSDNLVGGNMIFFSFVRQFTLSVATCSIYNRDFPENHILLFTIVNPVYPITVVSWAS